MSQQTSGAASKGLAVPPPETKIHTVVPVSGSSAPVRVRYNLWDLQHQYDAAKGPDFAGAIPLEKVLRAWAYITDPAKVDPKDPRSFFTIGGYHGEPFRGPGETDKNYWGGYCAHGNVLFPLWHRAYLLNLEKALQSAPGCEDVMQPFWDETSKDSANLGIPPVLTSATFTFKTTNETITNPLVSYKIPVALVDQTNTPNVPVYSTPPYHNTVRFPLSTLVGTPQDQKNTEIHNAQYPDHDANVQMLNQNIRNWLTTTMYRNASVHDAFISCLDAPNYTVFSNTTSAAEAKKTDPKVTSIESPHNSMHLAIGSYSYGGQTVGPVVGANGDMGENNTAGLDPIFYFHHCFIDYVFWKWQLAHNNTTHLDVPDASYPGTTPSYPATAPPLDPNKSVQGPAEGQGWEDQLGVNSPLYPFIKHDNTYITGADLIDISNLTGGRAYTYGPGSLDGIVSPDRAFAPASFAARGLALAPAGPPVAQVVRVTGVNRAAFKGSFVINIYATIDGKETLVGTEGVLSRRNVQGCANCQNHLEVTATAIIPTERPLYTWPLKKAIHPSAIKVDVRIDSHEAQIYNHSPLAMMANIVKGEPFQVHFETIRLAAQ